MHIKSNKLYLDYLDHSISGSINLAETFCRLKFDLLLFSEDVLCLSVPACVKLESTTDVLMLLTPFWHENRIKLILDNKHRNNPQNYFNSRKRVLEKHFKEENLINHFEYISYTSSYADFFYNTYIPEIAYLSSKDLYFNKVFDTDEIFRQSIIKQINENADSISCRLPINLSFHIGKIFNELLILSENRRSLFQRTSIINQLVNEHHATRLETNIVSKMLDIGFTYANGISCYAAPLSLVTNRLTGKNLITILQAADAELYKIICCLSWDAVFRLSKNDIWLDFIDHLNLLLILFQNSEKRKDKIYSPIQIKCSLITQAIIKELYESAIESLKLKLFKIGAPTTYVADLKNHTDKFLEHFLYTKNGVWDIIKQIDELIPSLKFAIKSLSRKYKDSTTIMKDSGYLINLDKGLY